jgi:hypothetical protein
MPPEPLPSSGPDAWPGSRAVASVRPSRGSLGGPLSRGGMGCPSAGAGSAAVAGDPRAPGPESGPGAKGHNSAKRWQREETVTAPLQRRDTGH